MKIAVSSQGGEVALHFGRCPEYTIFEVEDGKIAGKWTLPNPGHEPGFLPKFLGERGIACIIAGGMGPRAEELFRQQGIEVVTGVAGPVDRVIQEYLDGRLERGKSFCEHPGEPRCG
ncbi:MAG TPA: dinitrogenase iron-molybdenum cofactor [Firmicutes bacterium]|nr:dinitrogenase iron-molybdenum cofactor [Candidatus Fermentithermobacillaceae bacterium]